MLTLSFTWILHLPEFFKIKFFRFFLTFPTYIIEKIWVILMPLSVFTGAQILNVSWSRYLYSEFCKSLAFQIFHWLDFQLSIALNLFVFHLRWEGGVGCCVFKKSFQINLLMWFWLLAKVYSVIWQKKLGKNDLDTPASLCYFTLLGPYYLVIRCTHEEDFIGQFQSWRPM